MPVAPSSVALVYTGFITAGYAKNIDGTNVPCCWKNGEKVALANVDGAVRGIVVGK